MFHLSWLPVLFLYLISTSLLGGKVPKSLPKLEVIIFNGFAKNLERMEQQ